MIIKTRSLLLPYLLAVVALAQPQPDLTPEEQQILIEIQNNANNSNNNNNNNNINDELQQLTSTSTYTSNIQKSLKSEINQLNLLTTQIEKLKKEEQHFQNVHEDVLQKAEDLILNDIPSFHHNQLNILKMRILASKEEELERRTLEPEIVSSGGNDTDDSDGSDGSDDEDNKEEEEEVQPEVEIEEEPIRKFSKLEIESMLSLPTLTSNSETTINEKIYQILTSHMTESQIIPNQFVNITTQLQQKENDIHDANQQLEDRMKDMQKLKESCVDYVNVLNKVQSEVWNLKNDGGVYDHLWNANGKNGAVVVYGPEWTSDSYTGTGTGTGTFTPSSTYQKRTLGEYQHYMPEDWERLLPNQWKEFDITPIHQILTNDPRQYVPTSLWHSLPLPFQKLFSPPGTSISGNSGDSDGTGSSSRGSSSSSTMISKPPETIMSQNNNLGSCWAMAGSSGKITLRLDHPIHVQSVTIDHYPALSSAHDTNGNGNSNNNDDHVNNSAPRFIRLIGYPLCKDEDRDTLDCIKLGFDKSQPMTLGKFEYKPVPSITATTSSIDSSSIGDGDDMDDMDDNQKTDYPRRSTQTFVLNSGKVLDDVDEEDGDVEEDMFGGSCSATKPSCGSGYDNEAEEIPLVAAISVIVEENWGNEDFTCIYRVRVHGE